MDRDSLITLLKDMDLQQQQTDEDGQREVAWYYWRGEVEQALGLEPGELDQSHRVDTW